jgi:ribonuclease III
LSKTRQNALLNSQQSLLLSCQQQLQITFVQPALLLQALCHSSYANEPKIAQMSNERLEFLGDAVLDLVIAEYLFYHFASASEGLLTRMKANLVCEATLAKIAISLQLSKYLLLNKGEDQDGGRQKPALLADAIEAIFGAIYMDQGFLIAKTFILRLYAPHLDHLPTTLLVKDAKSRLNEYRQKIGETLPEYRITQEWGEDHLKQYEVSIYFDETFMAKGIGQSKKEASQQAAQAACTALRLEDTP